jgi:arsenite-transporting ATPase
MEIDATEDLDKMQRSMEDATGASNDEDGGIQSLMTELTNSIPGIDEAMSFSELMKQVQTLDYDVVVFDTAPTGHTLRLLSFPTILEKAFGKLMDLKDRFGGLIGQASALFGGGSPDQVQAALLGRLEETRAIINKVNTAFQVRKLHTTVIYITPLQKPIINAAVVTITARTRPLPHSSASASPNSYLFMKQNVWCRNCQSSGSTRTTLW